MIEQSERPSVYVVVFQRDDQYWIALSTPLLETENPFGGFIVNRDTLKLVYDSAFSKLGIDLETARLNASPVPFEQAEDVIRRLISQYPNMKFNPVAVPLALPFSE